jgi:hypothetical protein
MRDFRKLGLATTSVLLLALTACDAEDTTEPQGGAACDGGKCDTPVGDDEQCKLRESEVLNSSNRGFTRTDIRWACADVEGVNTVGRDDRGQEYCEYFAIVDLPTAGESQILGLNLGDDFDAGQTPFGVELDADAIYALEADPDANVGSCVFTSWNGDVEAPMRDKPLYVHDVPLTSEVFQMKYFANTLEAAELLIEQCISCVPLAGEETNPEDPLHDPFTRACYLNAELNGTQDRKSDTVVCAAAMRVGECGCSFADPGRDLFAELAGAAELGFPLGTWDDPKGLPPGCEYQPFGPSGQNIVTCELSAAEVLQNSGEIKAYCAEKYAEDVVVHVPIPQGDVNCSPSPDETYGDSCGATPWLLGDK